MPQVNPGLAAARVPWRAHWPIAAILAVAAVLLFANLGRDALWADEGDTAVLANSILQFGVPTAWDGVTFTDSDLGARLNDDLVMTSHPWLQYYVTAGSFALLGPTPFAARAPFALLGLLTIGLVYAIVLQVTRDRRSAGSAALLLMLSVQFLLYARQSRYYALTAALGCALVWLFLRLSSWRGSVAFAALSLLMFHSHPIGLAVVMGLGAATLVYPPFRAQRRWFWLAMPIVAVGTVPWLLGATDGYVDRFAPTDEVATVAARLAQFAIEAASVTSLPGIVVLGLWLRRRVAAQATPGPRRGRRAPALFTPKERELGMAIVAVAAACAGAMAFTQSRDTLWVAGMRYTAWLIPMAVMVSGILIVKAGGQRRLVWLLLVGLFGFTKVPRVTPWTFWEEPTVVRDLDAPVTFHNPERVVDRVLRTGQVAYLQSLVEPHPGTTSQVSAFLNRHAGSDDIVITNYSWEPIYFHTGLPQGLKILPSYPIWGAAKEHQLPPYVFSTQGVRWIVWRRVWGAYRGQSCEKILADLKAAGVPVTLVAEIPETVWENRENVHFRRYPDDRYLYPWFGELPSTLIYRVDWPARPATQS